MSTDKMELLHEDITDKLIKSFYKVYNELGFGFLEKVYQNALFLELIAMGFYCEKQKQIKAVSYTHLTLPTNREV